MVTCAVFATAIKAFLATAIKGTFGIVAVSIDVTVVGIGNTFVYIWRNKCFLLKVKNLRHLYRNGVIDWETILDLLRMTPLCTPAKTISSP